MRKCRGFAPLVRTNAWMSVERGLRLYAFISIPLSANHAEIRTLCVSY